MDHFDTKMIHTLVQCRRILRLFPVAPKDRSWALHASSFGHVRTATRCGLSIRRSPGRPPNSTGTRPHPADYQLIYIHEGGGTFESQAAKRRKLTRASLFILFPGAWHRYRPDVFNRLDRIVD